MEITKCLIIYGEYVQFWVLANPTFKLKYHAIDKVKAQPHLRTHTHTHMHILTHTLCVPPDAYAGAVQAQRRVPHTHTQHKPRGPPLRTAIV